MIGLARFMHGNDEAFREHGPGAFRWRRIRHGDVTLPAMELMLPLSDGGSFSHLLYVRKETGEGGTLDDGTPYFAWNGSEDEPVLRAAVDTDGFTGYVDGTVLDTSPKGKGPVTEEMLGIQRHPAVLAQERRPEPEPHPHLFITRDSDSEAAAKAKELARALVGHIATNATSQARLVAMGLEHIDIGVTLALGGLED